MSDAGNISRQAIKKVLDRVGKHKGVVGTVLCDSFGLPLQSSLGPDDAEDISAQVGSLVGKIKNATQEITGEISRTIRIETTNGDVEIIPDYTTEITIVALVQRKTQ
ncbi:MAG: roadblock/LC7 domain-containing protein [Candidatus Hodarchaeales archaeon]|jgi:predicted regulator of Ras-like GTPase activity (Roadblock/LC7/MglB family)